jgi:hypothetical protein
MFVYNKLGFLMLFGAICSGILAGVPAKSLSQNETNLALIQAIVATISLMIFDLIYRSLRHREIGWKRFFRNDTGGHFLNIPAWAYVPVMIIVGIIQLYIVK